MTTVINNPGEGSGDSGGAGIVLGVILALVLIGLFIVYVLPDLRNKQESSDTKTEINIEVPSATP